MVSEILGFSFFFLHVRNGCLNPGLDVVKHLNLCFVLGDHKKCFLLDQRQIGDLRSCNDTRIILYNGSRVNMWLHENIIRIWYDISFFPKTGFFDYQNWYWTSHMWYLEINNGIQPLEMEERLQSYPYAIRKHIDTYCRSLDLVVPYFLFSVKTNFGMSQHDQSLKDGWFDAQRS